MFEGEEMEILPTEEQQYRSDSDKDVDVPLEIQSNTISSLHQCQSQDATKLGIYDLSYKFKYNSEYDIGGSYTGTEPDFWFYYTTSTCPGNNYLLNLFVCHRKTGCFTICISNSNVLTQKKHPDDLTIHYLPETFTQYLFRSSHPDEHFFVKTFCFSEKDIKLLDKQTLIIPMKIDTNSRNSVDRDVIRRIKLEHDFGELLSKREKTDFVLVSTNGKRFPVHKIILAAHSPVLRNMIKNINEPSLLVDISEHDMELLLQFIYTGTIKQLFNQDCLKLLEIADKFQLNNLFLLTQYAIADQINTTNAIEIALLSEKYNLTRLQANVFTFIKTKPEVMKTQGWINLADVNLAKKLFQFIHSHGAKA